MDPKREGEVSCRVCKKKMKKKSLSGHMLIHDGPKFTCNICGDFKTSRKTRLQSHEILVHNLGESSDKLCFFCKKQFPDFPQLEVHVRYHTKERPYFCSQCTQESTCQINLTRHLKTHIANRKNCFACYVCALGFYRREALNRHVKCHTEKKLYKCEICSKQFAQHRYLQSHKQVHSEEKLYKCEICEIRFSLKSSLTIHIRTHTKEKPFVCKICMKGFAESSCLRKHKILHSGEKPYSCNKCMKTFSLNSYLKRHMKGVHSWNCK